MLNKQEINQCNASEEIVKKYNDMSCSIWSDKVFKKIDKHFNITDIFNEDGCHRYIIAIPNMERIQVIKFNTWDNVVTIMDNENKYAEEVYLVTKFLGQYLPYLQEVK